MTGFPHTPEGAIGQLAQIDLAVLQSMSLSTAEEVYNAWALPGGVRAEDWWITASVRAFLSSTGMGEVKDPSASVTLEPAAALVKGTDGPDWATVCVLMKVTATYKSEGQIAFAHCERMQWVGGRWMVAPGAPPAPAPATWPGTAAGARGRLAHLVHRPHHRTRPPRRHGRRALMSNRMSNRINDSTGESRTLLRVGVLVAIAALVATAVWLGARGRTDDNGGSRQDTTATPRARPGSRRRTSRRRAGRPGDRTRRRRRDPDRRRPGRRLPDPVPPDRPGRGRAAGRGRQGAGRVRLRPGRRRRRPLRQPRGQGRLRAARPRRRRAAPPAGRRPEGGRRARARVVRRDADRLHPRGARHRLLRGEPAQLRHAHHRRRRGQGRPLRRHPADAVARGRRCGRLAAGPGQRRGHRAPGLQPGQPQAVAPGTPEFKQAGWIPINGAPQ